MKLLSMFKQGMCVLLASLFVFLFALYPFNQNVTADAAELTPQQEKAQLEQQIKEAEEKLRQLQQAARQKQAERARRLEAEDARQQQKLAELQAAAAKKHGGYTPSEPK